ncbi:MAG: tetratricopeptide repeat protein [Bacteroidetes bacterium]|nr:tetratricopeptide repeat protein [Bacteroidota bacterium]
MLPAIRPVIYLAFANPSKKNKGVKVLKELLDTFISFTEKYETTEGEPVAVVQREGKEVRVNGFDVLAEEATFPQLTVFHIISEKTEGGSELFFNSHGGKRKAPDWGNLFLDHLKDLRLVFFDGAATADLVEKLLFAGAPVVIGIQTDGNEEAAESFRQYFYHELLQGKSVLEAFESSRELVEETFILRKIASDPYEYWEAKEKEDKNAPFSWGLYYLSANEDALSWRLISPEEVAMVEESEPEIEVEAEVIEETETEDQSKTLEPEKENPETEIVEEPIAEKIEKAEEEEILVHEENTEESEPVEEETLVEEEETEEKEESEEKELLVEPLSVLEEEVVNEDVSDNDETNVEEESLREEIEKQEESDEEDLSEETPETSEELDEEPVLAKVEVPELKPAIYLRARYSNIQDEPVEVQEIRTVETKYIRQKFGDLPKKQESIMPLEDEFEKPINQKPESDGFNGGGKETSSQEETASKKEETPKNEITLVKEEEPEEETTYEPETQEDYYTYDTPYTHEPAYKTRSGRRRPIRWNTIAGIGLGVLGLAAIIWGGVFLYNWKIGNDDNVYLEAFDSPDTYNILLLPFKPYADCKALEAFDETAVRDRLNGLQESIDLGIKVAFLDEDACPSTNDEASRIGEVYNANLVVWGNYPEVYNDSNRVHIRYVALDKGFDNLASRIGHIGRQAFGDVYELQEGKLSGQVDDIVYWALAVVHLQSEDYLSAISYLEQIDRESGPNISIVHHMLAKCYQGLGRYDEVLTHYNHAIQQDPFDANAFYNRGKLFQRLRQNDQALADYAEAISINSKHLKAHYNRKVLLDGEFEDGFYVEEMDEESLISENQSNGVPRSVPLENLEIQTPVEESNNRDEDNSENVEKIESLEELLSRGYQLEREGKIRDALSIYQKAVEKYPDNARVYFNRGATLEKTGSFSKALQDYAEAIKLDKQNIDYYGSRAYLYERLKQYYKAIDDYTKIISINPDKVDIYLYRGKAYQYVRRNEEALADFQEAIRRNPVDATGYYFRGKLYATLGESDNALSDYTQAIAINSGYASVYRDRGEIYLARKRFEKALADFDQVLTLNPHDAKVYVTRGNILLELNRKEEAEASYREALKLDPKNQNYQKLLAKVAG